MLEKRIYFISVLTHEALVLAPFVSGLSIAPATQLHPLAPSPPSGSVLGDGFLVVRVSGPCKARKSPPALIPYSLEPLSEAAGLIQCGLSGVLKSHCLSLWFQGHFDLFATSTLDCSQSAVGHEYVAEVEKHSSQTDAAKGFGGKFGVERDRADKVSDDFLPAPSSFNQGGPADTHP